MKNPSSNQERSAGLARVYVLGSHLGAAQVILAATTFLGACAPEIPAPRVYGGGSSASNREGRAFCVEVAGAADKRAVWQDRLAFIYAAGSIGTLGAGTVMVAEGDHGDTARKIVNGSLPVVGAALGLMAVTVFNRGKDASELAGTASESVNSTDDAQANADCNRALARWQTSRPSSDGALVSPDAGATAPAPASTDAGAAKAPTTASNLDTDAPSPAAIDGGTTTKRP